MIFLYLTKNKDQNERSHHTLNKIQPRITNTRTQLNKITELNSKRKYSLSTQAKKKGLFYMKNKIRLSSLTATLYARGKKVTYLRLEDRKHKPKILYSVKFQL